jgi:hypothetical protein
MDDNAQKGLVYCSLLALQFGLQPILASKFTSSSVSKSSVVIATELGKILIALTSIAGGPKADRQKIVQSWSIGDSLRVAALPATLYAIQNLLVQYGYIYLDSMTFNLLNQTKVWTGMEEHGLVVDFFLTLRALSSPPFPSPLTPISSSPPHPLRRCPLPSGCGSSWARSRAACRWWLCCCC